MADLDDRLRDLDRLDVPDLWTAIESRPPRQSIPGPPRRWPIAVGALVVAGLALALVSWAFFEGRAPSPTSPVPASPTVGPAVTNGAIWFQRGGGEGGAWIESVNPDGTGRTVMLSDPAAGGSDDLGGPFDWVPDGSRVAFEDYGAGGGELPRSFEIFTMNPDGSDRTQITHDGVYDASPSWSPDGLRIVYASDRDSPAHLGCEAEATCNDVWVINADGTGQVQLTNNTGNDWQPDWGPDGRIVFVRDRDGSRTDYFGGDLYAMNNDGSGVTSLTSTAEGESQPRWSPDGTIIAFVREEDGVHSLYVRSDDGSTERRLAFGLPCCHSVQPDELQDFSWSPDGTSIAFVSDGEVADTPDTLSTVNVVTGEITSLVQDSSGISAPAWRPAVVDSGPSPTVAQGCEDVNPSCIERLPDHVLTGDEHYGALGPINEVPDGIISFDDALERALAEDGQYSNSLEIYLGTADPGPLHWSSENSLFYAVVWHDACIFGSGGGPPPPGSSPRPPPTCLITDWGTVIDAYTGAFIVAGNG
jgi:Tol biopolymer transport system component